MNGVPVEHRRECRQRQQQRDPQPWTRKLPLAPRRHERKGEDCRSKQDRGVFRRQRQAGKYSRRKPPALIGGLREPDQRPDHRKLARYQCGIRRELRHQQTVIGRGLRHQHDRNDVAVVAQHAPDDVGEQQLHQQHGEQARKADAKISVAEQRSAEPDEPSDQRRMVEKRDHALSRPRPVIGFVHPELDGDGKYGAQQSEGDDNGDAQADLQGRRLQQAGRGRRRGGNRGGSRGRNRHAGVC